MNLLQPGSEINRSPDLATKLEQVHFAPCCKALCLQACTPLPHLSGHCPRCAAGAAAQSGSAVPGAPHARRRRISRLVVIWGICRPPGHCR